MNTTLTPQLQTFARVLKETMEHFAVLAAISQIDPKECQAMSDGVKMAITRTTATLEPEQRAEFALACGCPEGVIAGLMKEVDYVAESLKVFGTMDPKALMAMATTDREAYQKKCDHMLAFRNAQASAAANKH